LGEAVLSGGCEGQHGAAGEALEAALAEDIRSLPWMSDETKVRQEEAGCDTGQDRVSGEVAGLQRVDGETGRLVGNLDRNRVFEGRRNLSKLGKPVDEKSGA